MEKHLRILSLVFLFGLISTSVIGQRRDCSIPSVTLTPTISHATCFNSLGDISYEIAAPNGSYVNIKLFNEDGIVVYENTSYSLSGQVSDLPVGSYRFTGSVSVQYLCDGLLYMAPVSVDLSVWLGIETSWSELVDMIATPNSYSATRNTVNIQTYGGARSFNALSSGDGWIQLSANYGTSTNSHVYLIVGETSDLSAFTPTASTQYIEYYKTSTGSGVRVKHQLSGGGFSTTTLSASITDPIRLVRSGSTLTIEKGTMTTPDFTFPTPYTGRLNIGVFVEETGDAAIDVISSFFCEYDNQYHYLKPTVEETIAYVTGNLAFKFEEDYFDSSETLEYEIQDINGSGVTPITGTLNKSLSVDFYSMDISATGLNLASGRIYLITVTNEKGGKSYLKFKIA